MKKILAIFFVWRYALLIFTFFGVAFLPRLGNLNYWHAWANWDGGHYLGIAEIGYRYWFQFAFFPLYPVLIKIFAPVFAGNYLAAGHFISNLATLFSIFYLYRLVSADFTPKIATRTIYYFLLFPTAFFLVSIYTESLFFLTVVAAFYYARKAEWNKVALISAAGSAIRPFGILLFPVLILEYFSSIDFKLEKVKKDFLFLLLSPLGFLSYLAYLATTQGSPFLFLTAQDFWQRTQITFPLIPVWRSYLEVAGLVNFATPAYFLRLLELASVGVFVALLIFVLGKVRVSYIVFSFLIILLTATTGSLVSIPRLVLMLFPAFIGLSILGENPRFDFFLITIFTLFLGILSILFLAGFWVA